MNYGTRYFVLADGKIQQIGIERLSQLYHGVVPEYAGQKILYALLLFEQEDETLKDLRYCRGGYLVFDKKGETDQNGGRNLIELSLTGANNPKSFVQRSANRIRRENTWHPTGEQLNQMIAFAKKRKVIPLCSWTKNE
jgi:hypothetical protein